MNRTLSAAFAVAALSMSAFSTSASAGAADTFLAGLDGNWRGGGTLESNAGKATKVRCSLRNALAGSTLNLAGRCASSAGTRPVRGEFAGSGANVTAKSLKLPGAGSMRGITSKLSGNSLVLQGSVRDKGKTVPVRNTLTRNGNRLTLQVSAKGSSGWSNRGTITFTR